jgi:hypothetical protein
MLQLNAGCRIQRNTHQTRERATQMKQTLLDKILSSQHPVARAIVLVPCFLFMWIWTAVCSTLLYELVACTFIGSG